MIWTTYLDRICYRPGCDDRECHVLLPEGVWLGERATYPLRESGWSCSVDILPRCLTSGILLRRHSTRMSYIRNSAPPPFHPVVSHPKFCSTAIPPGCLTSGTFHPNISHPAPDAGWERRAFQLPRSGISRSSDNVYPESFTAILHNAAVFS